MRKLIAGLIAAIGAVNAQAALVQFDFSGTVSSYSYAATNNSDPSEIGEAFKMSLVFQTDNAPLANVNSIFSTSYFLMSNSGCQEVTGATCTNLQNSPPLLQSLQVNVGGDSYGMLPSAIPLHEKVELRKLQFVASPISVGSITVERSQMVYTANGVFASQSYQTFFAGVANEDPADPGWLGALDDLTSWPDAAAFAGKGGVLDFALGSSVCLQASATSCMNAAATAESFRLRANWDGVSVSVLQDPANEVPEPGTLALAAVALVGWSATARRRQRAASN